jgi:hypothetical protein
VKLVCLGDIRQSGDMTLLLDSARSAIRPYHHKPEPEVLAPLVAAAQADAGERDAIVAVARDLLRDLRTAQSDGWVNRGRDIAFIAR